MDLPSDVWYSVFNYLTLFNSNAFAVCKPWNRYFWESQQTLKLSLNGLSELQTRYVAQRYKLHARELRLCMSSPHEGSCDYQPDKRATKPLQKLEHLLELRIDVVVQPPPEAEEAARALLNLHAGQLRRLHIPATYVQWLPALPNLEEIRISKVLAKCQYDDFDQNLAKLNSTPVKLAGLVRYPLLKTITASVPLVPGMLKATDLPNLEHVHDSLIFLEGQDDDETLLQGLERVIALCKMLPNLKSLREIQLGYSRPQLRTVADRWHTLSPHVQSVIFNSTELTGDLWANKIATYAPHLMDKFLNFSPMMSEETVRDHMRILYAADTLENRVLLDHLLFEYPKLQLYPEGISFGVCQAIYENCTLEKIINLLETTNAHSHNKSAFAPCTKHVHDAIGYRTSHRERQPQYTVKELATLIRELNDIGIITLSHLPTSAAFYGDLLLQSSEFQAALFQELKDVFPSRQALLRNPAVVKSAMINASVAGSPSSKHAEVAAEAIKLGCRFDDLGALEPEETLLHVLAKQYIQSNPSLILDALKAGACPNFIDNERGSLLHIMTSVMLYHIHPLRPHHLPIRGEIISLCRKNDVGFLSRNLRQQTPIHFLSAYVICHPSTLPSIRANFAPFLMEVEMKGLEASRPWINAILDKLSSFLGIVDSWLFGWMA